jgi:protein-S-isoprenylcysteine O-methyltransferase Ste14
MNKNYRVVSWILILVGVSLALMFLQGKDASPVPLGFCTVAAGILTFFHFIPDLSDRTQGKDDRDARLRAAIAGAVIVQYLVLVGIAAYLTKETDHLPALTESLIDSFTAIVGIVVAFYFGSSAYIEVKQQGQSNSQSGADKTEK